MKKLVIDARTKELLGQLFPDAQLPVQNNRVVNLLVDLVNNVNELVEAAQEETTTTTTP